jgi:hypothetical protein
LQNEIEERIKFYKQPKLGDKIMTKQYQKTSSQITDLTQQNAVKKYLFCPIRT